MSTTVVIQPQRSSATVEVYWTQSLARDAIRDLGDLLEGIHGVEHVYLRRYSAVLDIAGHVTSIEAVATELTDLFKELDGPVASIFGQGHELTEAQ